VLGDPAVPAGWYGWQVAGDQHGGIGIDPATRSHLRAQRAPVAAAPDSYDLGGDAGEVAGGLR
jgi:hypothetical protein